MDALTALSIGSSLFGGLGGGGGGQRISQEAVERARQLGPLATFRPVTVTSSLGQARAYGGGMTQPTMMPAQTPAMSPAYTAPRSLQDLLRTSFTSDRGQTIRGEEALRQAGINLEQATPTQAANLIQRAVDRGVLTPQAGSMGMSQAQQMPSMMQPTTTDLGFQLGGQYSDIVNRALSGASGLFGQLADYSPEARAAEIYQEQLNLLDPTFAQQEAQLAQSLFGSGRLGLQLAGDAAGAGRGTGMVSPDVFGFQRARGQTLAQLAAGSRQQALTEGQQMLNLASGLLSQGLGVNQAERQMIALGIDAETARAAAQYAAGNLELQPYGTAAAAASQAQANRMGLFGGVASGLLSNPGLFRRSASSYATNRGTGINTPGIFEPLG